MRKLKNIQIHERKLGRENADAQVFLDKKLIEIDPRLNPKKYFSGILHELLHVSFPNLTEKEVIKAERLIFKALWGLNYRKISQ